MTTTEQHKDMFDQAVLEEHIKKAKNNRSLTKNQYDETVERIKLFENGLENRTTADFNHMRRFSLLRIEVAGIVVEKLVTPGTNLKFVPLEELFDTINQAHIEKGHCGRDIMLKYLSSRY